MVVEIVPGSPAPTGIPFVGTSDRDQIEVRGNARRVAVYTGPDLCLASDHLAELLGELERRGVQPTFDPVGISWFLHHGFAFAPNTVYDRVLELGVGDRLIVSEGYGYGPTCEWPWLNARSRQDQVASTEHLLELMVAAVRRAIDDSPATLLLSSGKDSVGLALAFAEAGRDDVRTLTFTSDDRGEGEDAAAFAERLGLEHHIVSLPGEATRIEELMDECFRRASLPCGDPTLVPYYLAVAEAGLATGEILVDGLNSDAWMGLVPGAAIARGAARSERWFRRLRPLRGYFAPESPASAALRTRAEWHLYGGRWLRHVDTRNFYPDSVDTEARLQSLGDALGPLDDIDFRSIFVGRHFEQNGTKLKARATAESLELRPAFPYDDPELAAYYFNLPEADRFNRASLTNKVLLRRLLRERLDYDDARLGKRVFEFDGPGFLTRHRAFVLHEIGACPLWNDQAGALAASLIDRPKALRKTWPSLLALFQLSGWITRHPPEGAGT